MAPHINWKLFGAASENAEKQAAGMGMPKLPNLGKPGMRAMASGLSGASKGQAQTPPGANATPRIVGSPGFPPPPNPITDWSSPAAQKAISQIPYTHADNSQGYAPTGGKYDETMAPAIGGGASTRTYAPGQVPNAEEGFGGPSGAGETPVQKYQRQQSQREMQNRPSYFRDTLMPTVDTIPKVGPIFSNLMRGIAGPDPRSPIAVSEPGCLFSQSLERDFKETRVAWSRDLGGLPVDSRVTTAIDRQRHVFESLGCLVEDDEPDFTDADEIFKVWRAWRFEVAYGALLESHREQLKDTVIWNIEAGVKLGGSEVGQAELKRSQLYQRVREFMETYEFLILPVNQVPPFDVKQRYITEINGVKMDTYIDWMKTCYYVTVTGLPAISVPCGFTSEGLPVGVQIVGRHQDELGVLQLAYAFEQATGYWQHRPSVAA